MEIIPLEHLILEQLVKKGRVEITRTVNAKKEAKPIYKQVYYYPKYKFGFVVDLVNNPAKYDKPVGLDIDYSKLNLFENEIDQSKYTFWDVSTALDVLAFNNDIVDNAPEGIIATEFERSISLKPEGVTSYLNKKYIEKELEIVSLRRKRRIEEVEYNLKRFWLLITVLAILIPYILDLFKPTLTNLVESAITNTKKDTTDKIQANDTTIQIPILVPTIIPDGK